MRIFYACIKNIVIVAFPILVAINCYYFLIELNPSLNFLNLDTSLYFWHQSHIESSCRYGGIQYFGLSSLKRMLEVMPTDNTVNVIRGLGYSFQTANFIIPSTIPNMASVGKETILNFLKVLYVVVGILFQPLVALGWLVYAVVELVIEIFGMLEVLMNAFSGMYASERCFNYPQELFATLHFLVL